MSDRNRFLVYHEHATHSNRQDSRSNTCPFLSCSYYSLIKSCIVWKVPIMRDELNPISIALCSEKSGIEGSDPCNTVSVTLERGNHIFSSARPIRYIKLHFAPKNRSVFFINLFRDARLYCAKYGENDNRENNRNRHQRE